MKTRLLCFFLFGCAASLLGQQAAPKPSMAPLPGGPLLKRTPSYSIWTVSCTGTPVEGEMPSAFGAPRDGKDKQKQAVVTQLTVVKTGTTIVEQDFDADGQQHVIWHVGGFQISMTSGTANPIVSPDSGGGDIYSVNFAVSDYAGLDWVSAKTYSGITQYQGRDCMVFNSSVSPLEGWQQRLETAAIEQARELGHDVPDAVKVPATAYIDLATRVPLFVQFGGEKCTYQYGPTPKAPIHLPQQVADPMKTYDRKIEALSAPASRPF
jgi:hypothetical protein